MIYQSLRRTLLNLKNKKLHTTICIVHTFQDTHHTLTVKCNLKMKIIELIPKKGIEHIDFGMTRDEVRSIMVDKYNAGSPVKRQEKTECFFENSLQFSFEEDNTLSFIEVSSYPPIGVRILGINTWEVDGKELLDFLNGRDKMNEKISEGGSNPIFQENIITLYELDEQYDVIGEFKGEKWAAIGIGDLRYYKSICEIYE